MKKNKVKKIKAKLEYPLPDMEYELKCAMNGWKYRRIIQEILNDLRDLRKYKDLKEVDISYVEMHIRELLKEFEVEE